MYLLFTNNKMFVFYISIGEENKLLILGIYVCTGIFILLQTFTFYFKNQNEFC